MTPTSGVDEGRLARVRDEISGDAPPQELRMGHDPLARSVGAAAPRVEDARLLAGRARWTDVVPADDALYLAVVRSPMAHGVIRRIDLSVVRDRPGVVAAYRAADLEGCWTGPLPAGAPVGGYVPDRWPLTRDKVRYVGDPVAVVIASSRGAAADAVESVIVEYEPLPAVPTVADAGSADAALVHDDAPGNVAYRHVDAPTGDVDAEFAAADVTLHRTYHQHRVSPASLETRAVLAVPGADGTVTVHTSTQVPHGVRDTLAAILGMPTAAVRVVAADVGGAFGAKMEVYTEEALCAAIALRLGRPVRWAATRGEDLVATTHGRGQVQQVRIAATRDGRLLALDVHVAADFGAYLMGWTGIVPLAGSGLFPGCYRWDAYRITVVGMFTTATPTAPYRGAGRPEATFAIERAMDDLADTLGIDPVELRRRNMPGPDAFPFSSAGGATFDSGDYGAALDAALAAAGYDELRAEQGRRRDAGAPVALGVGVSCYVEMAGFGPGNDEVATARIDEHGRVEVTSGLAPSGQGTATSLAQIASDALGVAMGDISVVISDTGRVPAGRGTNGSRSMPVGGVAVHEACEEVAGQVRRVAAHLLEAAADDIDVHDGRLQVRGSPNVSLTLADVARAVQCGDVPAGAPSELTATRAFEPPSMTYPFGAHIAVVDVDTETGRVVLRRFVAVDDVGEVINPALLDGQRHGGIAQGIGQALFEEVRYDADGNPVSSSLVDYLVPAAPDLCAFELRRTVTPTPVNPLGVKGVGEAGTIGAPPAVVNAIVDALRHRGVEDLAMPCTPERVWRALRMAETAPRGREDAAATRAASPGMTIGRTTRGQRAMT